MYITIVDQDEGIVWMGGREKSDAHYLTTEKATEEILV